MWQRLAQWHPSAVGRIGGFIPQHLPRCSQRKSPDRDARLFVDTTPKHKTAFLSLKFTVLSFGISWKDFKKAGKALKTAPFVSFRAKPWFRINGRDTIWAKKSALSSKRLFVVLLSAFMPSEWRREARDDAVFKARPHFEALTVNVSPLSEIQSARASWSSRKTWYPRDHRENQRYIRPILLAQIASNLSNGKTYSYTKLKNVLLLFRLYSGHDHIKRCSHTKESFCR